jgi:hypothetical protein
MKPSRNGRLPRAIIKDKNHAEPTFITAAAKFALGNASSILINSQENQLAWRNRWRQYKAALPAQTDMVKIHITGTVLLSYIIKNCFINDSAPTAQTRLITIQQDTYHGQDTPLQSVHHLEGKQGSGNCGLQSL